MPPHKRLLCVDDSKFICSLLADIFRGPNYETIAAHSMWDALSLLQSQRFDLYILETRLPDGRGVELCRKIRQMDPKTPIIFLSGDGYEWQREAFSAGAQDYLTKLDDIRLFVSAVQSLLANEHSGTKGNGTAPCQKAPAGEMANKL